MFSTITKKNKLILHAIRSYNFNKISKKQPSKPSQVCYGWRTFFFSLDLKASLTFEATLLLPLYILCLCAIIYIINILGLFNTIQIGMEESARQTSSIAYATDSLSLSSTNHLLLQENFLSSEMRNTLDSSYVVNGSSGLSFLGSYLTSSNNGINFSIRYSISLPFLPSPINIPMCQNLYFYPFIGEDISQNIGEHDEYVYVTSSGSVYHNSMYCSYLRSYFDIYPMSFVDNIDKGAEINYSPCHSCAISRNFNDSNVFLCIESNVYHFDLNCFYLNANAYKVLKSTLPETLPLCSRCQKGIGNE